MFANTLGSPAAIYTQRRKQRAACLMTRWFQLSRTSNATGLVMLVWRGADTGVAIVRSGGVIERADFDGLE